jgi:hypothetical protein
LLGSDLLFLLTYGFCLLKAINDCSVQPEHDTKKRSVSEAFQLYKLTYKILIQVEPDPERDVVLFDIVVLEHRSKVVFQVKAGFLPANVRA